MLTSSCTAFDPKWYPDSGATNHLTPNLDNLVNKSNYEGNDQIQMGNGTGLGIHHIGSSTFQSKFDPKILSIRQLLHVPSITKNLLSVSQFAKDNAVFFEFFPNSCYVRDQVTRKILMQGRLEGGLYVFDPPSFLHSTSSNIHSRSSSRSALSCSSTIKEPLSSVDTCSIESLDSTTQSYPTSPSVFSLWHNRLGHPAQAIVRFVMKSCSIPHSNKVDSVFCPACCLGKIHNLPFPSTSTEYSTPLQLVHTDLWGPSPTSSSNRYRYYIHFIDECTKFTWIYMLKNKSEAFKTFCNFKTQVELQLGLKIKSLQSDWGGEYIAFTDFLQSHGIQHRLSCPGSH